jgi:hypothetical protein
MVAVVVPPQPSGQLAVVALAPTQVIIALVSPVGTTKLCDAPVKPNVIVPPHERDAEHVHVAPLGHGVVQSAHTPLAPQATAAVPLTHVPPADAEQQPPLHACVAEQFVVHACVARSHALPLEQSLATLQPQVPLGRHAVPEALAAHETHIGPQSPTPHVMPHAPAAHVVMPPVTDGQTVPHAPQLLRSLAVATSQPFVGS